MIDPAASYTIINRKSRSALSVHAAGSSNGSRVVLWEFVTAEDQFWHIVDIGNGFYKIVNNHSGRALSTLNGGSDNGTIIHIWDYLTSFPDQHWAINSVGDGFYKITNQNSGRAVSCLVGDMADDTPAQLWDFIGFDNQKWSLIPITQSVDVIAEAVIVQPMSRLMTGVGMEDVNHQIYGGIYSQMIFGESFQEPPAFDSAASYTIINRKSRSALSVHAAGSSNGSRAVLWEFVAAEDQFWHIVDIANGFYKIVNNHSGRALSTLNGGSDNGTIIHIWDYLTSFPDQHWAINPVGDGFYKIANRNSRRVVSCFEGGTANDTTIQLWEFLGGFDDQEWSLIPVTVAEQGVSGMWTRINKGSAIGSFAIDTASPFQGSQSQKITFTGGDGELGVANQSLNRCGMNLKVARPYEGYVYLRAWVPAQVYFAFESAGGDAVYAEISVMASGQDWTRHDFTLIPNESDPHSRFAIKLKQSGSIDVGHVFIQPGDWGRFNGLPVRKDIAEGLVAQGNTVLRFGGSAVNSPNYRWNNMIGVRAIRAAVAGWWYPYDSNGWGIFDFLNFAESAGMLGIPAVNIDETPEAMADFLDYVNGSGFSFWELQRRADGHPEPYHLRYLELGNEEVVDMNYFDKFQRLATVIWAKDPDIILIVADYSYNDIITDPFHFTGNDKITTLAAHQQILDLARSRQREVWIDCHVWTDNTDIPAIRYDAKVGEQVAALHSLYTHLRTISPFANFKLVVFELNANRHDLDRALANALAIGMMQRLRDEIIVVTSANGLQPDDQNDNGWDQGLLFFNSDGTWAQPAYYVTQMKSDNYLPICIQANVSGRESVTFDVTATMSADGLTLTLHIVNTIDVARTYSINLNGFNPAQETARIITLTGSPGSQNSSTNPVAIVPLLADIPYTRIGNTIIFTFAPSSFTIVTLR